MQVEFYETYVEVIREPSDIRFKDESQFLYHLKNHLNKNRWFDLIKKRMWKDGHLVDEQQQYLRQRKPTKINGKHYPDYDIYIYNPHWAVADASEDFNIRGRVMLTVVYDVYGKGEDNA